MPDDPKSDKRCEELKVFYVKSLTEKSRIVLRVVEWARAGRPVLEYRRQYLKDGEWRAFKLVGMDTEVWGVVESHRDEITSMLKRGQ